MNWNSNLDAAPIETPVLLGRHGHTPVIAEKSEEYGWSQCLSGEFYGLPPHFRADPLGTDRRTTGNCSKN